MKRPVLLALLVLMSSMAVGRADEIRFVMEDFPPFCFVEKGRITGPLVDMIRAMCASIGKTCPIDGLPWRRAYDMAESGEVQGVIPVADIPERRATFRLLQPLLYTSYAFVEPVGSPWRFTGPDSLEGREIVVYGPSATWIIAEDLVRRGRNVRLDLELSNLQLLRKLEAGRYDDRTAGLINHEAGLVLIRRNVLQNLKFAGDVKQVTYSGGLSRRSVSEAGARELDDALNGLRASGKLKEIAARYGLRLVE